MHAHETRIYITLLIAAAVLAAVLGFYMITIIRQQRKKVLSYNDKIITEILVLEKERDRIAADLHDDMGPLLSAIKLNIQCMEADDIENNELIQKVGEYIDTSMHKIREIANNLAPKALQRFGLFSAIKEFCEMIDSSGQIKIEYYCTPAGYMVNKEKEIHLYRIIQEIVNNSIRHGSPQTIQVHLQAEHNLLSIIIKDDGVGFDENEVGVKGKGLGLHNIISRVDLLKGSIYLETAPGKGVSYLIEIPV